MSQSDLIGDLKTILIDEIKKLQKNCSFTKNQIELRTNFPLKLYNDDNMTLFDCELVPNANILVKICGD